MSARKMYSALRQINENLLANGWAAALVCLMAVTAAIMAPCDLNIAAAKGLPASTDGEFAGAYFPQNHPGRRVARAFPQNWLTYGANSGRNADFSLDPKALPEQLRNGVRWSFAGAGAIPLAGRPLADNFKTTAYTIGMPVGVSVVRGIVYVGDDNGYTYAINALTGKLIWAQYGWNMNMSNPLVDENTVIVSTGNAYFNYEKTMRYIDGKRTVRGPGLNSIYALDRRTGRQIWVFHTPGEVMPTPVDVDGYLYVGTGDGHVYKLSVTTGKLDWRTDIQSFVSMSSPVAGDGKIFLGGTYPNYFYALDQKSGKIIWKVTVPDLVATGMGDCTPAYADGIVVQEVTVKSEDRLKPVKNVLLGMDAKTGTILWRQVMNKGAVPPAMKTATPTIYSGVVYEGSPVSGNYHAFDLKTGTQLWTVHLGSQIRAGAAIANNIAYVPYHSGVIAAIRVVDGKIIAKKRIGGAFGPSSPVIVGNTLYVSNVYGWVIALPLRDILSSK